MSSSRVTLQAVNLVAERGEITVKELALALGLAPSTAHRILKDCQACGFVRQDEPRGPYVRGPAMLEIALLASRSLRLRDAIGPVLQELFDEVDDTVGVLILEGRTARVVQSLTVDRAGGSVSRVGWTFLAHSVAGGRAMLAVESREQRRRRLGPVPPPLADGTRPTYHRGHETCDKRVPGSGCSAVGGATRQHAVLGASDRCIATHPSDMAVALAVLDAQVRVVGPHGDRMIPFTELHRLPGDFPERDTILEHGDLITAIDLPELPIARRSRYRKVRDRASYAFGLVSVAAALDVVDGTVRDVRLAFGGVAHKPWRAYRAEQALRGQAASDDSYRAAAAAELVDATPQDGIDGGNGFKIPLLTNTLVATLRELA